MEAVFFLVPVSFAFHVEGAGSVKRMVHHSAFNRVANMVPVRIAGKIMEL